MCAHDTVFYDQALVDQKENCPSVSLVNDICDMHFSPFLSSCKLVSFLTKKTQNVQIWSVPALVSRHYSIVNKFTSDISHFMSIIHVFIAVTWPCHPSSHSQQVNQNVNFTVPTKSNMWPGKLLW